MSEVEFQPPVQQQLSQPSPSPLPQPQQPQRLILSPPPSLPMSGMTPADQFTTVPQPSQPAQEPGFFSRHKGLIITACAVFGAVFLCQLIGKRCKETQSNSAVCKTANAINSIVDAIAAPFVWVFNHLLLLLCLGLVAIGLKSVAGFFSSASDAVRDYLQASEVEDAGDGLLWVKDGEDEPYLVTRDGKPILNKDGDPLRPTEGFAQRAQDVLDANRTLDIAKDININISFTLNGNKVPPDGANDEGEGVSVDPQGGEIAKLTVTAADA